MFSITELIGMRKTQEAHMMDDCVIYPMTSKVKDKRGVYQKTFGAGVPTCCSVQMEPYEVQNGETMRVADVDVILRLPLCMEVKPDDEIEIVGRFGQEITPQRYEVMRFTNNGVSGCRAYLKAKTVL